MSFRAILFALEQRGRWAYLFYAITFGAIAGAQLSYESLMQVALGPWVYLGLSLFLLVCGILTSRSQKSLVPWLWVLLSSIAAIVAFSGGAQSPWYALVYLFWVAAPVWASAWKSLAALALGTLGLELALAWSQPQFSWIQVTQHLVFCALFWGTHRLVFGGYLRWLREQQQAELIEQHASFVRDAQDYRLGQQGDMQLSSGVSAQDASVSSLRSTIDFELDLLRDALNVHSVVLLWPVPDGEQVLWSVKALRSDASLRTQETLRCWGLFAPFHKGGEDFCVQGGVEERHRFYYSEPTPQIQSLCAVAMRHQGELQGVLLADRVEARPFSSSERQILRRAGEQLVRCLAQERAFTQVDRQKQQHAKLHAASVRLSQALGMAQLQQSSLEALSLLLPNDLALLFVAQSEPGAPTMLSLVAQRAGSNSVDPQWLSCVQAWAQHPREQSAAGMVGGARKNRVVVAPKRIEDCEEGLCLFGDDARLMGACAAAVLPLAHAEHCDAVAVLLSKQAGAFIQEDLTAASILVNQIGAAMQNAQLYDQMQRQATTDGLTGLANHRTFQTRLDEALAHVQRSSQPLSLILTDIDHFKQVNDRYGHPVGDAVLQAVAQVLAQMARKNDLVARYGGEEFVLLLPGSDASAACSLAERLRTEVEQMVLEISGHVVRVTLSLGVAQWQGAQDERQFFIDRADKALYACKGAGRNCVRSWSELQLIPTGTQSG